MYGADTFGGDAYGGAPARDGDIVSQYTAYFLHSTSDIVQYETVEISHPDFTQTFYVVRNNTLGITANLEDHTEVEFVYYPLRITPSNTKNDLDQTFQFELGDLGEIIPIQIDAIAAASGFITKPTVKYRTYRSDLLTQVMYGPIELDVINFTFTREAALFEAKAPSLNMRRTGTVYSFAAFPLLRGFL